MISKLVVVFFSCLVLARATDTEPREIHYDSIYNGTGEVTLKCDLEALEVVWSKDNKSLVDAPGYKSKGKELTFAISRSTIGDYECHGANGEKNTVSLITAPILDGEDIQKKNAINDETFVYECKGYGNPKPVVTWRKGNGTVVADEGVDDPRIIIKNSTDMYNAILKIKRVQAEDGGEYVCEARTGDKVSRTTLIVSIKDKYAALWPFLGICVEVAVLCAIILLIEKKRSKKDEKVVLVDENNKSPNKQSEELRQRK